MYINGMTNVHDTIMMIKDTIDDGELESAKDYLDQLKEAIMFPEKEEEGVRRGRETAEYLKSQGFMGGKKDKEDSSFMKNYQEGGAGYDDTQEYEENSEGDIVPVKKKKNL